jgi:hypothetical protein
MICCVGLGKSPVPLRQEVGEVDPRGVALQRQLMAGRGGGGGRNREGVGPSQEPEENDRAVISKNSKKVFLFVDFYSITYNLPYNA